MNNNDIKSTKGFGPFPMSALESSQVTRGFYFSMMYLAQGVSMGFTTITLTGMIASQGKSSLQIAQILGWCLLPWTLKWVAAPIVDFAQDSSMGKRRPWVIMSLLGMAVSALILTFMDIELSLNLFVLILSIHNVCAALQDIAVDALAVDLIPPVELCRTNGFMAGSKTIGISIGGAALTYVVVASGLDVALLFQACFFCAVSVVAFFFREPKAVNLHAPRILKAKTGADLLSLCLLIVQHIFRAKFLGILLLSATVFLYRGAFDTAIPVYLLQSLSWKQTQYSFIVGGPAVFASLVGSVTGGMIAQWLGVRRLMTIAIFSISILLVMLQYLVNEDNPMSNLLVFGVYYYCDGILLVGFFSMCMQSSQGSVAASVFTSYMSIANVSSIAGSLALGYISILVPPAECVSIAGLFTLPILISLALVPESN